MDENLRRALDDEGVLSVWETLSPETKQIVLRDCYDRYEDSGYSSPEEMIARVVRRTYDY